MPTLMLHPFLGELQFHAQTINTTNFRVQLNFNQYTNTREFDIPVLVYIINMVSLGLKGAIGKPEAPTGTGLKGIYC